MTDETNSEMVHHLESEGKQVILVGTAHVSSADSTALVEAVHHRSRGVPTRSAVELCAPPVTSPLRDPGNRWQEHGHLQGHPGKKGPRAAVESLMLASHSRNAVWPTRLDIRPGRGDAPVPWTSAEADRVPVVHLADRDIRVTTLGQGLAQHGVVEKAQADAAADPVVRRRCRRDRGQEDIERHEAAGRPGERSLSRDGQVPAGPCAPS
jgi:pheromone shutdown protein TraB